MSNYYSITSRDDEEDEDNKVIATIEIEDESLNIEAKRREGEKLNSLSENANIKNKKELDENKFFNISLYKLAEKTAQTPINVLNDVLASQSLSDVSNSFTKDDRLIYVGIVLTVISIIAAIILITIRQ